MKTSSLVSSHEAEKRLRFEKKKSMKKNVGVRVV